MFMELNKFVKYFLSPTLEVGGSVIIFIVFYSGLEPGFNFYEGVLYGSIIS